MVDSRGLPLGRVKTYTLLLVNVSLSRMPPLDGSGALSLLFKGYSARRVAKVMGASNVAVSNLLAKLIL